MSDDDKIDREIGEALSKLIEELIKNGELPFDGRFSMTITGGRIPIDMLPPELHPDEKHGCGRCGGEGGSGPKIFAFRPGRRPENMPQIFQTVPHTEVSEYNGRLSVFADMPGAEMSNTAVSVQNGKLIIASFTGEVKYSAAVDIPSIKKETMHYSLINGVLDVDAELAPAEEKF